MSSQHAITEHAKARRSDMIFLPESIGDRLMWWYQFRRSEFGRAPKPRDRVFSISRRLTPQFLKDCKFAGIPLQDEGGRVVDFHSLRHTYAQLLVRQGVHPRTAQTMLRHRDIRTTMKVYVRDDIAAQVQALSALPALTEGDEVHHQVHHLGGPARQGEAKLGKRGVEDQERKLSSDGTLGKNGQEAAAQGGDLSMVAGAPVVAEKKRPGFLVDFTWQIDAARAKRPRPRVFDVTRCAA